MPNPDLLLAELERIVRKHMVPGIYATGEIVRTAGVIVAEFSASPVVRAAAEALAIAHEAAVSADFGRTAGAAEDVEYGWDAPAPPATPQRCPCSFEHPPHDLCDGNHGAKFGDVLAPSPPPVGVSTPDLSRLAEKVRALKKPTGGVVGGVFDIGKLHGINEGLELAARAIEENNTERKD